MKNHSFSIVFLIVLLVCSFFPIFELSNVEADTTLTNVIEKVNNAYRFKTDTQDYVEIGDSKAEAFEPTVTLNRWNNEAYIKMSFNDTAIINKTDTLADNKVAWTTDTLEIQYYPQEPRTVYVEHPETKEQIAFQQNMEGGVECELILKQQPTSNTFLFPFESKNLCFLYQPALDPEHPTWKQDLDDEYSFRPLNVVGSYAVYHIEDKSFGGETYQGGKAFHLYRPHAVDAEKQEVWCSIHVDTKQNLINITIPQDFLDSAVYPIKIGGAGDWGYTTAGGSFADFIKWTVMTGRHNTAPYSPPWNGVCEYMKLYCQNQGDATKIKMAIYDDGTGEQTLRGYTVDDDTPAAASWLQLTITSGGDVLAANDYQLALFGQDLSTDVYYDTDVNSDPNKKTALWGAFPNPCDFAAYPTWADRRVSIYAYVPLGETVENVSGIVSPQFNINSLNSWTFNRYKHIYPTLAINSLNSFLFPRMGSIAIGFTLNSIKTIEWNPTGIIQMAFGINNLNSWLFNREGIIPVVFAVNGQKTVSVNLLSAISQALTINSVRAYSLVRESLVNPTFTVNSLNAWSFSLFPSVNPTFTVNGLFGKSVLLNIFGEIAAQFSINSLNTWIFSIDSSIASSFTLNGQKTVSVNLLSAITQALTVNSVNAYSFIRESVLNPTFTVNHQRSWLFNLYPTVTPTFTIDSVAQFVIGQLLNLYGTIDQQFTINNQRGWSFQLFPSITPTFTIDSISDFVTGIILNLYGEIATSFNINFQKALSFTLHPIINLGFTINHTLTATWPSAVTLNVALALAAVAFILALSGLAYHTTKKEEE